MYRLRTIAKQISDWKIVIGAITVVLGTVGSLVFGILNFYLNSRTAPLVRRIEATEQRDVAIEQTLVELKTDNKEQHRIIESKLDRLLIKLIK